jgi:RimJ/RimL family protein N-acetyltransferase
VSATTGERRADAPPAIELREAAPEDFELVRGWLERPETHRWLDPALHPGRLDRLRYQLLIARRQANRLWLATRGGAPIGLVGLSAVDGEGRSAEIWYALGPAELAGRGLMSRAVNAALDRAFGELGLRSVRASIAAGNLPSERLLRRLGFREAGRWRASFHHQGQWTDRIWFDIIDAEWPARAGPGAGASGAALRGET